ncbi:hypothetical protein FPQ18DRAFT_34567 [Pyronema domesticum]|nr:hypothetical protein FPQ18DRAFT_34567 [Pyronema domesticum]
MRENFQIRVCTRVWLEYTYFGEFSDKVGNHARRITRCISNCVKGTSSTVPGEHTVSVATRRNSSLASDFSFYTVEITINSLPQRTGYGVTVKFHNLVENGFSLAHTDLRCPPGEWWLSENLPQIADLKLVNNGPPESIMLFQPSANFHLPVLIGIRDREVWYYIDSESNYERFWPKWKWYTRKRYPGLSCRNIFSQRNLSRHCTWAVITMDDVAKNGRRGLVLVTTFISKLPQRGLFLVFLEALQMFAT